MAYQSLYRRYRPQRFAEVWGQEHLVRALRAAVAEDRVGHAYLFSGPRGTGKTTTARILAKSLNCVDVVDGEPCGKCDSCRAIERGASFDLQELDAASNRGIGEMRALLETTALGTPGRTKVYILDEVHMLTKEASAALLKTLEEPPSHVVFVLATTDPQKVLPTIRSRCQHFELSLLSNDQLRAGVEAIVADAGLELSGDQIAYAIRKGGGSARDTLSVLDQVILGGMTSETADAVERLVEGMTEQDAGTVLAAVQEASNAGREPRVLGELLVERLRDAFLVSMGVEVPHLGEADLDQARRVCERLGPRPITRALELLGDALVEMRQAPDPRIPLELALVRITRPEADLSLAALAERIDRLERRIASGGAAPASGTSADPRMGDRSGSSSGQRQASPASSARQALEASGGTKPALGSLRSGSPDADAGKAGAAALPTRDELTLAWGDTILSSLSQRARTRWAVGRFLAVEGGAAVFGLPNKVTCERCAEQKPEVEQALERHFGRPVPIQLQVDEHSDPPPDALDPAAVVRSGDPPGENVDEAGEVGPIEELADAGDLARTGVSLLTEAFPGAEVIDVEEPDG